MNESEKESTLEMQGKVWRRKPLLRDIERGGSNSTDGLVGYDTALTRLGPRVRLPLGVVVLPIPFIILKFIN